MTWADMTHDLLGVARDTFGEQATLRPGENHAEPLVVIFRSAHLVLDPATGTPVQSTEPVAHVRLVDVVGPPIVDGTVLEVRGVRYLVRGEPQPDGEGGARLALARA